MAPRFYGFFFEGGRNMLVKWNGKGLWAIPIVKGDETANMITKEKMEVLVPGWNEIDNDRFDAALPSIYEYFLDGRAEPYGKVTKDEDEDGKVIYKYEGKYLLDVRADVARNLIKECFNVALLEKWMKDPKVEKEFYVALKDQLDACLKGDTEE
jgi:hypothetical protein